MQENPYQRPEQVNPSPTPAARSYLSSTIKALVVLIVLGVLVTLLLPAVPARRAPRAVEATQCRNQLKNIALALLNYEAAYGSLPPAYTVDAAGKPLHSWRTLLLPYLEQQKIYDLVDFSKPWDDPANQAAREQVDSISFAVGKCPSVRLPKGHTMYLGVVTPRSCLRAGEPVKFADVKDDFALTLAIVEVDAAQSVHWMSPQDASAAIVRKLATAELPHSGIINAAFLDGTMRNLRPQLPAAKLEAMITIDGHDDAIASDADVASK